MEGLSISSVWKVLNWLPPIILKRIFTKKRMGDLVLVDVRPRYDYATVNLGKVASFDLWLQMINLSPFNIELDRAELKFWCGGIIQKSSILKKYSLNSGQTLELYFSENISDDQATQIAQNLDNHQAAIELEIEFNCKLHNFSKSTGHLEGVRPRFINQDYRKA